MADETAYQALNRVRSELAAETARANAAEAKLSIRPSPADVAVWDGYMRAVLVGLCNSDWTAREIVDRAETITAAAIRARQAFQAGASRHQLQPVNGKKKAAIPPDPRDGTGKLQPLPEVKNGTSTGAKR